MKIKNAKSVSESQEKSTVRVSGKSRDAVETAIALAKRSRVSTWEETFSLEKSRFLPWTPEEAK